ncbi:ABC transporter permease [Halomonas organivorans]|uniref:Putative ABC transport system permease protein n=1 Tax=Halomonas organivorans TaxID=257772 RepID=A0A7W5C162_9GAMM|nr:FtsX-like permease family protein [Halomonas organivorans]MBB3142889.1 putative ABC transport system permease protein [Halomonas organivorans]
MSSLDRKLIRELWRLRAQVLAIALVIASGTALLIMALTTIEALEDTTHAYYERSRFGEVFADVTRAPESLTRELAEIPGVQRISTRIVEGALLDLPNVAEPVIGRLVSLPEHGVETMNALVLRSGRRVAPGQPDEVVLGEPFAEAHGIVPGDRFEAILRGRRRTLLVVGTALSPEYVYAIAPGGLMPDDERFGVLWMGRKALAAAFDLDGAFNAVSLGLTPGTDPRDVMARLDARLAPYGGTGAYPRAEQTSNWFLQNEIAQQKNMAHLLPSVFLAVSAFLTHLVMGRMVDTERREIGLLKAFGYSRSAIAWHYAKQVLVIGGLGVIIGALVGAWLGHWNTRLYAEFYRFPFLLYRPGPDSFLLAALVSLGAALLGGLAAVRRAASLPPAQAMLPPSPPVYRRGRLSRSALAGHIDEPTRMILRRLMRWPLRALLASTGLAMSVAVLVMALQWLDAIDSLVDSVFVQGQHQDATLGFHDLQPLDALTGIERLPGVLAAEPLRGVPARLRHGTLDEREAITGLPIDAQLSPVTDVDGHPLAVPPDGLLLSRQLADMLAADVGDTLRVEILEGRRPILELPVVRLFDTYLGKPAYMSLDALNHRMGDGRVMRGARLAVDPTDRAALLRALKTLPAISAVQFRQAAIDKFYATLGQTMFIFVGFFVAFATVLSVGVTYNAIRIALAERARELATLRVLGFSRWEISYILLGEVGLLTWLAIPLGCLLGYALAWYLASAFATELFRVPLVILDATYGKAALIALATTVACAAVVRRRLDRLDLVAVLKTRE